MCIDEKNETILLLRSRSTAGVLKMTPKKRPRRENSRAIVKLISRADFQMGRYPPAIQKGALNLFYNLLSD